MDETVVDSKITGFSAGTTSTVFLICLDMEEKAASDVFKNRLLIGAAVGGGATLLALGYFAYSKFQSPPEAPRIESPALVDINTSIAKPRSVSNAKPSETTSARPQSDASAPNSRTSPATVPPGPRRKSRIKKHKKQFSMVEISDKVVGALEEKSDSFSSSDEESDSTDPLAAVSNEFMVFPKIPSRQNSHADLPVYLKQGPPTPRKTSQQIEEVDESGFEEKDEETVVKTDAPRASPEIVIEIPTAKVPKAPTHPPKENVPLNSALNESPKRPEVTLDPIPETVVTIDSDKEKNVAEKEKVDSSNSTVEAPIEMKPRLKQRIKDLHKAGSRASAFFQFGDLPIEFHEDGVDIIDLDPGQEPLDNTGEIVEVNDEKEVEPKDKKKKDEKKKKDKKKEKRKEGKAKDKEKAKENEKEKEKEEKEKMKEVEKEEDQEKEKAKDKEQEKEQKKEETKEKQEEKDETKEKPKKNKLIGIKKSAPKHKVFHSAVEFDSDIVANAKERLLQITEAEEGENPTPSEEIDS